MIEIFYQNRHGRLQGLVAGLVLLKSPALPPGFRPPLEDIPAGCFRGIIFKSIEQALSIKLDLKNRRAKGIHKPAYSLVDND